MERQEIVVRDGSFVQVGPEGERRFGRRHFMDVTSLFLTEPLLLVRWGARDLGQIDPSALLTKDERPATILLGGRAWRVQTVDWAKRIAWATPSEDAGRSRWMGSGAALSSELCRAMRTVLVIAETPPGLTDRGAAKLAAVRAEFVGVREGRTMLVRDDERATARWWTFAGGRANAALAHGLDSVGIHTTMVDDLSIGIASLTSLDDLRTAVGGLMALLPEARVEHRELEGLKFADCLPVSLALRVLARRRADFNAVQTTLAEPMTTVSGGCA